MGKRADSKILHRLDEAHVLIFKAHAGMGAVILEGHEIDAIVRYIGALEQEAARRTTPDRESIIEECAKVCEMERDALRKNEAIWDAYPNLRPDEEYISEWESSACRGEEYAKTIRALKTTSTAASTEES